MMNSIDLNCDLGEGMATDADIMPYISSANIACGYHAGDADTMKKTIDLCLQHGVVIGAHPGYADKANFGRVAMELNEEDLYDLIVNQIMALHQHCEKAGTFIHHVKPHGALYNTAAINAHVAAVIVQAIKDMNPKLIVYGLSGSHLISEAKKQGLKVANEVFADRTYQNDGTLTSRTQDNALITDTATAVQQVMQMIHDKSVNTTNGKSIPINADTVCLHGDGAHAVSFAKNIYEYLKQENISIASI